MPFIKPKHTVKRIIRTKHKVEDELGNDVWVSSETEEEVKVIGWAVPQGDEPKLVGHERRTVAIELFAPSGIFNLRDAVKLPNREELFEVVGEAGNYDASPFWAPNVEVINLAGIE